jgi:hypothetical protein
MALLMLFPWLAWLLASLATTAYFLGHGRRRRDLPPGPRPLPVIGSLHLLGNQPHRSLARLARTHGPLLSLRLGSVTTVVASSPAAAREFLQRHDAAFSNRSVPDAPGDHARNSSVWLPNAPRWRALRKIMGTELFAPHRLDALQHLRREKARELVDHVARLARRGEAVDVGRVAFTTSLNLVSRTIFSRDLTSLDDDGRSREFQEVVTDIMEAVGYPNISDYFPALAAADLQGWRRHLARLFARLHRIFDEEIDGRLRSREAGGDGGEPRKNDFLDLLLDAAEHGDNTAGLDRDTLRSLFTVSRRRQSLCNYVLVLISLHGEQACTIFLNICCPKCLKAFSDSDDFKLLAAKILLHGTGRLFCQLVFSECLFGSEVSESEQ